jgi:hypothetical protein
VTANSGSRWTRERAKIAPHRRHHPGLPVPDELRANLRAARMADYIERKVAEAPPLSARQRELLARILNGPGAPAAELHESTSGGDAE